MDLSYPEKMRFTRCFLDQFRLRLTDKTSPILPSAGKIYHSTAPHKLSLPGSLGGLPDPSYSGPQPPNAMGMVLLVAPDESGNVSCKLSGQFDVSHRYIPDISVMNEQVLFDDKKDPVTGILTKHPRNDQIIATAFVRYTVCFNDIIMTFSSSKGAGWQDDDDALNTLIAQEGKVWTKDLRVMRHCHTSSNGGAKFNFPWSEAALATQDGLVTSIHAIIFDKADEILQYSVKIRGRLRVAPSVFCENSEKKFLLEIYLQNCTRREDARPFGVEQPFLLDSQVRARLVTGTSYLVPHRLQPEDYRYVELDGLPGYGVSCSVEQDSSSGEFFTNSMPTCKQPRVDTPPLSEVGMTLAPDYQSLSLNPLPILSDFVTTLDAYLGDWTSRISTLEAEGLFEERDVAIADRESFSAEIGRVRDGVNLLEADSDLRQCFQWMNEAMWYAIQLQGKSFTGWHLFQLGFILTQIRSIYERFCETSELRGSTDTADVLWFATGGGKTEAYLGIISMAMLYARQKGKTHGTCAWMRFPLRMLSVQQFQRLSYVIAQSNCIRQREHLGGWPFTLGYYTGGGTPSRITSSVGDDGRNFLPTMSDEKLRAYQFIADCPYCGQQGSIGLQTDIARARIMHICKNDLCWSNTDAELGPMGHRGEIGIYVSDEEVYRHLPTVLVGTVDKLAVIAHNRRFMNFMGAAKFHCPEHGFSQKSKCEHYRIVPRGDGFEAVNCGNNTRTVGERVLVLEPMRSPGFDFLVQDELHLLQESLGNFDSHYETLLTALQTAHGGRPAKCLAATATIKDFEDHIHHLYFKKAVRFPAPGVMQGESFYARRAFDIKTGEPLVRRWFTGLLPLERSMRSVAAVGSHFLDQVDVWRDQLREQDKDLLNYLGFEHSLADVALAYLEKNLNTELIYVNRKRNIPEVLRYLEDINANSQHERIITQLDAETPLEEILAAIHHIEVKKPDDTTRQLIATSVVSHGVDIAQLNFMVVAGWPKSTAEYIQASARSGRVHPGIIVCVLNAYQLFETNVFLNFTDFHFFIERLVDAVPINRFAPNVADRTLPGVLSAVLINWAPMQDWGKNLTTNIRPLVDCLKGKDAGLAVTAIKGVILNALRLPKHMESAFDARVVSNFNAKLDGRIGDAMHRLEHWSPSKMDQSISEALGDIFGHQPMRSFRDIENQIAIKPMNSTAEAVLDALAR